MRETSIHGIEPGAGNYFKPIETRSAESEPPEGFIDSTVYRYKLDEDGNKVLIGTMDAFPEGWHRSKTDWEKGFQKKKEDEKIMARYYWKALWPQAQELLAQGLSTAKVAEKLGIDAPALRCKIDRERRKAERQTPEPEPAAAANQEPEREKVESATQSVAQEEPEITVKDVLQYELAQRGQGFGPEDDEPIPYQVVGKYESLGKAIGALVDRKNKQYGDAFNRGGSILEVLYPDGVRPEQYRDMLGVIRVVDKLFRVANGKQGSEDPWQDIAGYGLLGTGE
jgi:hypothetical protein